MINAVTMFGEKTIKWFKMTVFIRGSSDLYSFCNRYTLPPERSDPDEIFDRSRRWFLPIPYPLLAVGC
jgi:hypothetical protein